MREFKVGIVVLSLISIRLFMALVLVSGFGYQFAGFGYQLYVSLFCVVYQHITQHVRGGGGCTTKKVAHYKKLVPKTRKLVPEIRTRVIAVLDLNTSCLVVFQLG